MCGRFIVLEWDEVLQIVRRIEMDAPLNLWPEWPARTRDARPGSTAPVVVPSGSSSDAPGALAARELRWGFPAPWDARKLLFNTRVETALEQPEGIWGRALREGRCVVPTLGFFEPSATETVPSPRTGRPVKRQYEFARPGGVTLLAGVCQDGAFSVVTTEPNADVAPIHDRMPLVLREGEVRTWLRGNPAALADRSGLGLDVRPEDAGGAQTSLF